MIVTATNGGSSQLILATVIPFSRENLSVRGSIVAIPGSNSTGARLRLTHLMSVPSGAQNYIAAAKDMNGCWSEWSSTTALTPGSFSAGSNSASIGSGAANDQWLGEPSINFPDLSIGSGTMKMFRTIVSQSFMDEVRRSKWVRSRAGFKVVFTNLDQIQMERFYSFVKALNGPLRPFYFDFTDHRTQVSTRYVVRFSDPGLVGKLFAMDYSSCSFGLVEVMGTGQGGDV